MTWGRVVFTENHLLIAIHNKLHIDFQVQRPVLTLTTGKIKPGKKADENPQKKVIDANNVRALLSNWVGRGHTDSQPNRKV